MMGNMAVENMAVNRANPQGALDEAVSVASLRADMFAWLANQWEPKAPFEVGAMDGWRTGWEALAAAVGENVADESAVLLRQLASVADGGSAILREHDALFVTRAAFYAAPFESVYAGAFKDDVGWSLSCLRGFPFKQVTVEYTRDGFVPAGDLLPDHLSIELRYMAALCVEEANAFATVDFERAEHLRARQTEFLTKHLLTWLPTLCERLAGSAEETFYPHASRVMLAYVKRERDYLGAAED